MLTHYRLTAAGQPHAGKYGRRVGLSKVMAQALTLAHAGALHHWGGGFWLPVPGKADVGVGRPSNVPPEHVGTATVRALESRGLVRKTQRDERYGGAAVAVTAHGERVLALLPTIAPAAWATEPGPFDAHPAWERAITPSPKAGGE